MNIAWKLHAFALIAWPLPLEHSRMIVNGTKDPVGAVLDRANAAAATPENLAAYLKVEFKQFVLID